VRTGEGSSVRRGRPARRGAEREAEKAPRPLFVGGCQRSGTTAFADYLNDHDAILLTRERYKRLPARRITPGMFTFERILAPHEGETNAPRAHHEQLLARKEPSRLRWIGDKRPAHVRSLPTLLTNNPSARFIVLHRPLEDVAESFEAKARDPAADWPASNGLEAAVVRWNAALRSTRAFVQSRPDAHLVVIGYDEFFGDPQASVPLLTAFLELEFDEDVLRRWGEASARFVAQRREKVPPTASQARLLREARDEPSERWIRGYIRDQRRALA